jgi:putative hydrolase of the HAD superfamily
MKKITAIGFDWSGVIVQYPAGNFNEAAAALLRVATDTFRRAYFLHSHLVNKGTGVKGYAEATEMWRRILAELGKEDALSSFMDFIKGRPEAVADQQMIELIRELRNAGWKVGLFSNHSIRGARAFRDGGYEALFDAALFSSDVGYMKPEPEAFLMLAERLGVPVTELAFIDDSERSLSTASIVGYTPILFTDRDALIGQLKNIGVTLSL